MHIAELEQDTLHACHCSEAESRRIYPSQMEYNIKKDQDTGGLMMKHRSGHVAVALPGGAVAHRFE